MKNLRSCHLVVFVFLIFGACSKAPGPTSSATAVHSHDHHAPHGGTAVVLGEEAYHLEFVHTPETGTLTAYLLDGHMEDFIRTSAATFGVIAQVGNETRPLTFRAVGNPSTGETVGDTAQFEVQADWLKSPARFQGTLKSLTVRGRTFSDVPFTFPGAPAYP